MSRLHVRLDDELGTMTSYVIDYVNSVDMIVAMWLVQCVEFITLSIGGVLAQFRTTLVENEQTNKCLRHDIVNQCAFVHVDPENRTMGCPT